MRDVYLDLSEDVSEETIESFTKIIPISRIVTVGLFDPQLYDRFDPNGSEENDTSTID